MSFKLQHCKSVLDFSMNVPHAFEENSCFRLLNFALTQHSLPHGKPPQTVPLCISTKVGFHAPLFRSAGLI